MEQKKKKRWKTAASLVALAFGYALWQKRELGKFCVSAYETHSKKVNQKIKLVVISDLHSFCYGKHNERLIRAVRGERPDLILIPGDLIVSSMTDKYEIAADFAQQLVKIAPVIFSNGNHESRVECPGSEYYFAYKKYRRRLERAGVLVLNNESRLFDVRGCTVCVAGLEVPLSAYRKGKKPYLDEGFLPGQLKTADNLHLQLLLAHNPAFAGQYARWGADITLCGHNHGGLVRLPFIGSLISPQFMLFPKYDAGEFDVYGKKVYISRGLGTHTFHIRIGNRAQLMAITVVPETASKEQ